MLVYPSQKDDFQNWRVAEPNGLKQGYDWPQKARFFPNWGLCVQALWTYDKLVLNHYNAIPHLSEAMAQWQNVYWW
jgi:hypothetical protein